MLASAYKVLIDAKSHYHVLVHAIREQTSHALESIYVFIEGGNAGT